ncbi:MAG TPA: hypothetical protein VF752_00725 [Thermoleophilaceae bacterium]
MAALLTITPGPEIAVVARSALERGFGPAVWRAISRLTGETPEFGSAYENQSQELDLILRGVRATLVPKRN